VRPAAPGVARFGETRTFARLSAQSPAMHEVFDLLERLVRTEVTITLCGETGVGKDVLAMAIHEKTAPAGAPIAVFDCGSVPANLAESELLGHERGAFTGAVAAHAGAFERAHGGTLFLDEVAELPLDLQPRLLRALESRRVRRVGGRTDRAVQVRVVAATHRDLKAAVAAGRFREDLFFRLAVVVVHVPPLRRRLEDLPLLASAILADLGHPEVGLSAEATALLRRHPWPGNVRELKNALACALPFLENGATQLEAHHLRLWTCAVDEASSVDSLPLGGQTLERLERAAIRQTLAHVRGNKVSAARALGVAVSTLYEKLKKYEL
jgi:DNA-binding NtrC family response regulator